MCPSEPRSRPSPIWWFFGSGWRLRWLLRAHYPNLFFFQRIINKKTPYSGVLCCLSFFGINADLLAGLVFSFESYYAVLQSEERIIAADADIVAGMELGSSLTNEDSACADELTVSSLDS